MGEKSRVKMRCTEGKGRGKGKVGEGIVLQIVPLLFRISNIIFIEAVIDEGRRNHGRSKLSDQNQFRTRDR